MSVRSTVATSCAATFRGRGGESSAGRRCRAADRLYLGPGQGRRRPRPEGGSGGEHDLPGQRRDDPCGPEVREAMLPLLGEEGQPRRGPRPGVAAARGWRRRRQVAAALGVAAADLVFTSGGSEANALALRGVTRRLRRHPGT